MDIRISQKSFDQRELNALVNAYSSPWILNGPKVREFEVACARHFNSKNSLAVTSCTAGIDLLLRQLRECTGRTEVIVPAFNFAAIGAAVASAGCTLKLCDVDETGVISPASLRMACSDQTLAVVALHYAGKIADIASICEVAAEFGTQVIEDAAHSTGYWPCHGMTKGAVLSFGPTKTIVTGMGGMILSNDDHVISGAKALRNYGMTKSAYERASSAEVPWEYDVHVFGANARMTDTHASIGLVQLERLEKIMSRRKKLADQLINGLRDSKGIEVLHALDILEGNHGLQYFVITLPNKQTRDELGIFLRTAGIEATVHWPKVLNDFSVAPKIDQGVDIDRSKYLADRVLSIPCHQEMTDEDMNRVVETILSYEEKLK